MSIWKTIWVYLFKGMALDWRRVRLRAHAPACPGCYRGPADLRDAKVNPALWACRFCGMQWWQDRGDAKPVGYPARPVAEEKQREVAEKCFKAAAKKLTDKHQDLWERIRERIGRK